MKRGKWTIVAVYFTVILIFLAVSYGTDLATTTVAQLIPMEREVTIVIDAGHGGVDGGATSCTGVLESKFNLDISLKLEDMFHLLGYRTIMIRRTDVSVYTSGDTIAAKKVSDLRQRVKIVNETEDALLISIHQNTFSDGRYSGAQVFYADTSDSRELAGELQQAFSASLDRNNQRVCKKADGVYLMQHIDCTGVLVECGFLSNPLEEAKLRDDAYQQKMCCVIAATAAQFLTK